MLETLISSENYRPWINWMEQKQKLGLAKKSQKTNNEIVTLDILGTIWKPIF